MPQLHIYTTAGKDLVLFKSMHQMAASRQIPLVPRHIGTAQGTPELSHALANMAGPLHMEALATASRASARAASVSLVKR